MSKINKNKTASPLVQSVIALDNYFSELIRLGARIEDTDMKSNFDFEQDRNSGRESTRAAQAANLIELFEPMRGLLTDEEADTLFTRNPSTGRPVDLG